jgi:flavin-dependent thymidylate synthase
MTEDVVRWADEAQYHSQPILKEEGARVTPRVFLLSATPDPLGAIAAAMRMFRGDPPYSLAQVTDEERRWAWEESIKTHLKAPWEMVDFQFMIEGVTRSFTHQLVRQRTAVYAQESLRFAVKDKLSEEIALPPSLASRPEDDPQRVIWDETIRKIDRVYNNLVNAGVPSEDARGLLPHAVTTRVIYKTNFRGLMEHAGNRLCTQAQFEWRAVFLEIMQAIGTYTPPYWGEATEDFTSWQFELIAKPISETFAPVCYKVGHCVFMSELDRGCTIRERVNNGQFDQIDPAEWMANANAGRTTEDNVRPE